jgi:nitric oxide reductase large subunit
MSCLANAAGRVAILMLHGMTCVSQLDILPFIMLVLEAIERFHVQQVHHSHISETAILIKIFLKTGNSQLFPHERWEC